MAKIFFMGDIFGKPGRQAVQQSLQALRQERGWDLVIANAENAASGAGPTVAILQELLAMGIDAITLGDHVWDQHELSKEIGQLTRVSRPANLPSICPGQDYLIVDSGHFKLGVVTVLGRVFMRYQVASLLDTLDQVIEKLRGRVQGILVEVHAEATSEKIAVGWYLDGKVTAVVGTHTHVPTADARILPKGTGYITDVGMSGPYYSVIGRQIEPVLEKMRDDMPRKFHTATEDVRLSGCEVEFDPNTGLAQSIQLLQFPFSL